MVEINDYASREEIAWCPGCGNFGILNALKKALVELELSPHQVLIVSGIGQAAKTPHYLKCNTFNGLHGRSIPVATGAKIANHELTVITEGGDGDNYGEGGNHLIHAIRRNIDITVIVHNNQIYGLTKGQASPTTDIGMVTKNQPHGVIAERMNPIALAVSLDASFVARGFSGDMEHLTGLIKEGIRNSGFSLIDVLQPCVAFNKKNTYSWYRERVYRVEDGYDPADKMAALKRAEEWEQKIPIGVLYRKKRPTFESHLAALKERPLVKQSRAASKVAGLIDDMAK